MRRHAIQPRVRRAGSGARAGLTLAELSVSLAVIATLMVAIGSVMVLTGRAVGMTATQAGEAKIDDVVTQIASEARMSMSVPVRSETSVTFTVADRDGDGLPEKIQYLWGGKGQSLFRKVNNLQEVPVLANVASFRLGFLTKSAPAPGGGPQTESTADELFYAHESGSTFPHTMTANAWSAQSLAPSLKPEATSWRVTQVQIHASRFSGSTTGKFWTVSLCPSDLMGKPNLLAPIDQKTLQMANLSTTATWSPAITFTSEHNLAVSQRYWIVVSQSAVTTTGSVSYDPSSSKSADPYASTAIAGNWSLYPGRDMKIRVFGRYKYPAP
jgi:hypothetical protein